MTPQNKDQEIITVKRTKLVNEIVYILKKKLYIKESDDNWLIREYIVEAIKLSIK